MLAPGDDLDLVRLLRHRVATGKPFAAGSGIREADVCSAPPADLTRDHGLCMDLGEGKGKAYFFCSPANYTVHPGVRRRKRKVDSSADAGGPCFWHPEAGQVPILDPDKKSVGAHKRKLSYVCKIKNPPGSTKAHRNQSLGWIMVEIGLEQQQQLVLCKVYESHRPRSGAEASTTEACGGRTCPAPPPAAATPAPSCDYQATERKTRPLEYDHHFPGPGVGRKPPPSFKHARRCGNTSGVAIRMKAAPAAAVTVVMKFGGSLTQSADKMKEMAKLVRSLTEGGGESPVVVLSAMGNTTNNLLLAARKALSCHHQEVSEIRELVDTKELHFRCVVFNFLCFSYLECSLDELENIFRTIAFMTEMTARTRDYLVSFGEHMSTRIFSAYLNKLGEGVRQENVENALFQEWESYAVNTCGRGGSDLTMTTIGRDLKSKEIQVWKDVDGVLTCDPKVYANAIPRPYLTFDEAAELGLFDGQVFSLSMQLAMEGGIQVTVKNLCNPQAPGTLITKTRDMSKSVLTSIVSRSNITVLNIESTRMLGHSVFVATSFSTFGNFSISVDCVAISEGRISLIVVPTKLSSHELIQLELDNVVEELEKFAVVHRQRGRSVISLTGGTHTSQTILVKALNVLQSITVEVQKFSQGSSKVIKVSFVVDDCEVKHCVQALHSAFFEEGFVSAASSGDKRKADDDHPEAALQRTDTDRSSVVEETEHRAFSDKAANPTELLEDDSGNLDCVKTTGGHQLDPEQPSNIDDYPGPPIGGDNGGYQTDMTCLGSGLEDFFDENDCRFLDGTLINHSVDTDLSWSPMAEL
ncbi:Aspartokinase 1, chloroplastic [Hordeum vulgare]|nr:Aspartokinase 1, chloroplastic [Hordeum vulgare]